MKNIILTAAFLLICGCAFCDSLDTLIEVARGQAAIAEEASSETKNFEAVRDAIENKSIQKGQSKESILDRYGPPVIKLPKDKYKSSRWVYKPASASFFDGPKIYILFDDNGSLCGIESVVKKEGKKEEVKLEEKAGQKEGGKKNEMSLLRKSKRQRNRL